MIRITKDGRTIRTGSDYAEFRRGLYALQGCLCVTCGGWTNIFSPIESDVSFHVAHRGTRGMGASRRDDVIGPNKGQVEGGKCGKCHRIEHGQQEESKSPLHWSRHAS